MTVYSLIKHENTSTAELHPAFAIFYLPPFVQFDDQFTSNMTGSVPTQTYDSKSGQLTIKVRSILLTLADWRWTEAVGPSIINLLSSGFCQSSRSQSENKRKQKHKQILARGLKKTQLTNKQTNKQKNKTNDGT